MTDIFDDNYEVLHQLGTESKIVYVEMFEVIHLHNEAVNRFGGKTGVRDHNLIESAVNRPMNLAVYENERDPIRLAASLCYGLVKNHGFIDGNKRSGFLALTKFLKKNDVDFSCDNNAKFNLIRELSDGELTETDFFEALKEIIVTHNNEYQGPSIKTPGR